MINSPDCWNVAIDAMNGDVLFKYNRFRAAAYNVHALPMINPDEGERSEQQHPHNLSASPYGWHDIDGKHGAEFLYTKGNNVHVYADHDNDVYRIPDSPEPNGGDDLIFNPPLTEPMTDNANTDAAIVNLFYWFNLLHDIHFEYGFDEEAGNFQYKNYSNDDQNTDNDAIVVRTQIEVSEYVYNISGGAGFRSKKEGEPCSADFYVIDKNNPGKDPSFDNEVIIHEYGHGVANRLTGGADDVSALGGDKAHFMDEGWADFWALSITAKKDVRARSLGSYVTDNPDGFRSKLHMPWEDERNEGGAPYTYRNIFDKRFYQGHDRPIGPEVWCATLWDIYWDLVDKHGFDPDVYRATGGNNIALQLVMDGLKLQPAEPTFLDARDAILLADLNNNNGENLPLLWKAFARRGMGVNAYDGGDSDSLDIQEDFMSPLWLDRTADQLNFMWTTDAESTYQLLACGDLKGSFMGDCRYCSIG